jgi:lauroyl/myristoyl acyltransferase
VPAAVVAARAAQRIAGALPGEASRRVAEAVGLACSRAAFVPALSGRRALAGAHLRRAGARHDDVGRMFASYARYWAESFRLPALSTKEIAAGMSCEGLENIEASQAQGRGTILALPHLGGWEWGGAWLVGLGYKLEAVAEVLEPAELFEWFVSWRRRIGIQIIPVGPGSGAACARALAANRVLCLICDRLIEGSSGVEVDFFGERTLLPAGVVTLGLRSGAAVLPTAVYFGERADDHFAWVRPPLGLERRGRLGDDVRAGTQALASELELLIRRAPEQWHLMQPNWPSDPGFAADAARRS